MNKILIDYLFNNDIRDVTYPRYQSWKRSSIVFRFSLIDYYPPTIIEHFMASSEEGYFKYTKLKKQNFDGHDIKFVLTKSGIEFLKEYKKFKDL